MNNSPKIILAIESAICGGSISLLRDGNEVAHWVGSANVSKAEDLLANIDTMLASNNFALNEIDLIAVSAGPGSFTGIRIGIATALGLKSGLGVGMASESALAAMAFMQSDTQNVVAALPVGRNAVCLQAFEVFSGEVVAQEGPRTMTESEFQTFVHGQNDRDFVLHSTLYEKFTPSPSLTDFGTNIAFVIGRICTENSNVVTKPLFICKTF